MLTDVFVDCGQSAIGPRQVVDQSNARISAPHSPPPCAKLSGLAGFVA